MLRYFTDTKPLLIAEAQVAPGAFEQLQRRAGLFRDALRAGRTPAPLVLSADEVNTLIANDPELKALKGRVYIISFLERNRVSAQISLPVEELGLSRLRGRFFNGAAMFSMSLKNGILYLYAENLAVKGRPLPGLYMKLLRGRNLATRANEDARISVGLNQLQKIEINDGKLIVVPKNISN